MFDRLISTKKIDFLKLAEQGEELSGRLPVSHFERFGALLVDKEGCVDIMLRFFVDSFATRVLAGELKATVNLECQRCLGKVAFSIDSQFCLAMVCDEKQSEEVQSSYEPLMLPDRFASLMDIVEDELILTLPVSAMHEDEVCRVEKRNKPTDAANAFSILAKLK